MVKTLTKHGNSRSIILDKPILELLEIDDKTPLRITTDGQSIVISPVRDEKEEKQITSIKREMHRKYGRMMKRLAE